MIVSERIRRGFWRIGLLGLVLGGITALLCVAYATYEWLAEPDVTVYFRSQLVTVPVAATDDALAALTKAKVKTWRDDPLAQPATDWWARIQDNSQQQQPSPGPGEAWRSAPIVDDIGELRAQVAEKRRRSITSPLWGAAAAATVGAAWLAIWWVLGWIVRGFLD